MKTSGTYQSLNQLLTILYRSLPVYLLNTSPWTHPGDEAALASVRRIAKANDQMAQRVAEYIISNFGPPEIGKYPNDYYDLHDLSLDYLLLKLIQSQKEDVAGIEAVLPGLASERAAAVVGEEALGAARAHLETLEELAGSVSRAVK